MKPREDVISSTSIIKNNINPQTIKKDISGGVLETLRGKKARAHEKIEGGKFSSIDPARNRFEDQRIKIKMKAFAKALDFESAAKVRDEIKSSKRMMV